MKGKRCCRAEFRLHALESELRQYGDVLHIADDHFKLNPEEVILFTQVVVDLFQLVIVTYPMTRAYTAYPISFDLKAFMEDCCHDA